ncbi:MAG TPA: rhomboid family intramembrane serine protease [Bacteroidetes bacterium]|nr:rhomboid family intramembrane serine protease [Bacteroidota bacterium]
MNDTGVIGTLLLLLTAATTYKGLRDNKYFEDNLFEVDGILIHKEYKRLLSAGFLHSGWIHFGFNMIALTAFSWSLELMFGYWKFLLIYFASLIGGNLLALYIHRNHGDYRAVGASGAISGVIFSSILLFPTTPIHFIFLPKELGMPGWLFGMLFIAVSIFGIKSQKGNIGHEAHLGGALVGAIITLFFIPFENINWWVVAALLVPTISFLYLIANNPSVLMVEGYWGDNIASLKRHPKSKNKTKIIPINKQAELDLLLEKIGREGLGSLSKEEKERLDKLTNEL